ncbi:MAG TPA: hypothetical protein PK566_09235 [Pseudobacteroides sp.]|nr:hypothetical protein [Pseudobacteroides sp.]
MKTKSSGEKEIQFLVAKNSEITGKIKIQVSDKGKRKKDSQSIIKINYQIKENIDDYDKNDAIIFSGEEVVLKVGQKLVIRPENDQYFYQLLVSNYPDIIKGTYFFIPGESGNVLLYEAVEPGQTVLEFHVAHSFFMKGHLKITVYK